MAETKIVWRLIYKDKEYGGSLIVADPTNETVVHYAVAEITNQMNHSIPEIIKTT